MIIDIQKRWKELKKKKYTTIAKEFSISIIAAKKYVNMSKEDIQMLDSPKKYKHRRTATDDYINMIYKMILDGIKPEIIFSYVVMKGYKGTWKALNNRIVCLLKNNFSISLPMKWYIEYRYPDNVTIIKRNEILKYITTKNEKIKKNETVEKNIQIIKERYPIVNELEKIYDSFYSTIMKKDADQLDKFIDNYKESVLKGFIEGIEKDIAPIKNAISYSYSSGFVEGNNNKFKLIKRILYGRSKIVNLFRKCYIPFLMKSKNFKLIDMLEQKNSTISCAV